jgi:predicted RNA-binding protein with PIN domain
MTTGGRACGAGRVPRPRPPASIPAGAHLVVDGMNVIGSTPDGWWRDRDGAVRQLLRRLERLSGETARPVTLVLDGRPPPGLPEGRHGGVTITYAVRGGRDAGDDRLVEVIEALPRDREACVITSDRALGARVKRLGASVRGAMVLRAVLDRLGD